MVLLLVLQNLLVVGLMPNFGHLQLSIMCEGANFCRGLVLTACRPAQALTAVTRWRSAEHNMCHKCPVLDFGLLLVIEPFKHSVTVHFSVFHGG